MSDRPTVTDARLAGAHAALLRHVLITAHGVDPDYVDAIVGKHADRIPHTPDGQVDEGALQQFAARVADEVPDKFKDAPGDAGEGADVYAGIRAEVARGVSARRGPSGAERLARGGR